jgi:hypothetical protein
VTDEPKASEPPDRVPHGADTNERDFPPELSPDQERRLEQEWRNLVLAVIAAKKSPLKYSEDAIVEMAQSQKRFSDELYSLATGKADREELQTVDKRHVRDAARDLHTRKSADWSRAFGMFFLALTISQLIRIYDAQTISISSVNVLVIIMILTFACLFPAIYKERPWRLPIQFRKTRQDDPR